MVVEHEHEWVLTILEVSKEALEKAGSSSMIPITPAAICECDERLLPIEIECRLNATDKLSAAFAIAARDHLRKLPPDTIPEVKDALAAYAVARKGK